MLQSHPASGAASNGVLAVPKLTKEKFQEMLAQNALIEKAHARATREALLEHARMGRSVCESRGGQVVWIPPEVIFARYGLDENGRPPTGPDIGEGPMAQVAIDPNTASALADAIHGAELIDGGGHLIGVFLPPNLAPEVTRFLALRRQAQEANRAAASTDLENIGHNSADHRSAQA